MLTKKFVFFPGESKVVSVCIKSHTIPELNKTLETYDEKLFSTIVRLNASREGSYYYEVTIFGRLYNSTTKSDTFHLKQNAVQRDISTKKFTINGFKAHLDDIAKCDKYVSFLDLCMEIENLCLEYGTVTLNDISHSLLKDINSKNTNSVILSSLVIAILGRPSYEHMKSIIKSEIAKKLLSALVSTNLDSFPSTCQNAMLDTCEILYKIVDPKNYSVCGFVVQFFTFMGEKRVKEVLEKHLKGSNKDICVGTDRTAGDLFQLIHEKKSLTCANELQAMLLAHLPVGVSIRLYKTFCADLTTESQVTQSCKGRCIKEITTAISAKNLKRLLEFPFLIENTKLVEDTAMKDKFEKGFIVVVKSINQSVSKDTAELLLKLIDMRYCFHEENVKINLLETLAMSKAGSVSDMFLSLINHQHFRSLLEIEPERTYMCWLKNKIGSGGITLCQLFRGASVLLKHNLGHDVEHKVLEFVSAKANSESTIKDFFRLSDQIEDIIGDLTHIRKLYLDVFHNKLIGNTTSGPNDMLQLCLRRDALSIHTR